MFSSMNDYYSSGPSDSGYDCQRCGSPLDDEDGAGKIEMKSETLVVCGECLEDFEA